MRRTGACGRGSAAAGRCHIRFDNHWWRRSTSRPSVRRRGEICRPGGRRTGTRWLPDHRRRLPPRRLGQNQHDCKQYDRRPHGGTKGPDPSPAPSSGVCGGAHARLSLGRFENGFALAGRVVTGWVLIKDRPGGRWRLALLRFRRLRPLGAAGVVCRCHAFLPLRCAFWNRSTQVVQWILVRAATPEI